ncbi:hypothetical protein V8F33_012633 [Rhypophila sp. PSN 637]
MAAEKNPHDLITVPITWSTPHKEHIKYLEAKLTKIELEASLCKVDPATLQDFDQLELRRALFFDNYIKDGGVWKPDFKPGDPNCCHGCGLSRPCFFTPLYKCPKCSLAWYHSEKCRAEDWERGGRGHRYICGGLLHPDLKARLRKLVLI